MKVKLLKTGPFGLNPWGPVLAISGKEYEGDESICRKLIKSGWAENTDADPDSDHNPDADPNDYLDPDDDHDPNTVEGEGEEQSDPSDQDDETVYDADFFTELISSLEDETDKKQRLQDWGVVNFNHKVSKSKTIENMIAELVEITNKNTEE